MFNVFLQRNGFDITLSAEGALDVQTMFDE
jgi:hypothetical protein